MSSNEFYSYLQQLTLADSLCLVAALLALLGCLIVFVRVLRRQPKTVLAYTTENGRVMVSRQAIVELVQTSCEQLEDISKPHVRIQVKGQTIHFKIRIKLLSGGRLRQIEETLQSHLRKALTENLGIEALGQINIIATSFKSARIDSNLPAMPRPPASETTEAYEEDREDDVPDLDEGDEAAKKS